MMKLKKIVVSGKKTRPAKRAQTAQSLNKGGRSNTVVYLFLDLF